MSVPNENGTYKAYDNEAEAVVKDGTIYMTPANSHTYEHAYNVL